MSGCPYCPASQDVVNGLEPDALAEVLGWHEDWHYHDESLATVSAGDVAQRQTILRRRNALASRMRRALNGDTPNPAPPAPAIDLWDDSGLRPGRRSGARA